jgi:hypothetical protein
MQSPPHAMARRSPLRCEPPGCPIISCARCRAWSKVDTEGEARSAIPRGRTFFDTEGEEPFSTRRGRTFFNTKGGSLLHEMMLLI